MPRSVVQRLYEKSHSTARLSDLASVQVLRRVALGGIVAVGMSLAVVGRAQAATAGAAASSWNGYFNELTNSADNTKEHMAGVIQSKINGQQSLSSLSHGLWMTNMGEAMCNLTGCDSSVDSREKAPKPPNSKPTPTPATGSYLSPSDQQILNQEYGRRGVLGSLATGISYLYQPPATTQTYVADLLDSAHMVPKAQAQGLGFAALDPILTTWKIFRNLAYLFYVVIFLVIGFMVMFRQKMGQTVVSMQQAIPNIIVSLLFVTFSYAIAGFLIDLMYLVMYLIIGMFSGYLGNENIMDYNFISLGASIIVGGGGNAGAISSVYEQINTFISTALAGTTTDQSILGALGGITMALIMAVAIVFGVFKLFFELLKTYVTIVLQIAFSPVILMFGAVPGQNPFKQWVTDIIGNLAAFPVTLLLIVVFRMFTNSTQEGGGFMPPFLIGRGVSGAITTLVGIGVVLIMSEVVVEAKKAIGVKEGVFTKLGQSMIQNFGSGATIGAAPVGAGLGAIIGGAKGAALAAYTSRNQDAATRRYEILTGAARGAQFGAGGGVQNTTNFAKYLGAKTPSKAGFLDTGIQNIAKDQTEEGYLKNVSDGKLNLMEKMQNPDEWLSRSNKRLEIARGQARLKRNREKREADLGSKP